MFVQEDVREVQQIQNENHPAQNKSVGGDRQIFVGKVAVFSHVLSRRMKLN